MSHVRSKPRSQHQILKKPCVRTGGHIFSSILLKSAVVRMFALVFSWMSEKMVILNVKLGQQIKSLNSCSLMLYDTIWKTQVSDSRAIMALLFLIFSFTGQKPASYCHGVVFIMCPSTLSSKNFSSENY